MARRKTTAKPAAKQERTTKGIRDLLFDEIDLLRSGEITPQRAKVTAALIGQIVATSKLDMEYARFLKSTESEVLEQSVKPLKLS